MGKITSLADLTPDPRNARKHNPRNVGMIETALGEVGAARSIVIDENGVVLAGNATIEAAAQAGIERVQVVEADGNTIVAVQRKGLTEEQKAKLALYDNRATELADWDAGVLAALAEEVDLSSLFRDDELAALLAAPVDIGGAGDAGGEPNFDAPTECQPGDVWQVGRHIVACLDSTEPGNLDRVLAGKRPQMVWADPPYGIDLDTDYSQLKGTAKSPNAKGYKYEPVHGDDQDFDPSFFLAQFASVQEQFWWGADYYASCLPSGGSWLVWLKRNEADAEMIGNDFELCWSKTRHKKRAIHIRWVGWDATEQGERRVHPTQKPVGLVQQFFSHYGSAGDIILDPFLGSGPSLKAAERSGRTVIGCELSPHYCDHIIAWGRAAGLSVARRDE